jgi:hypothetical protein
MVTEIEVGQALTPAAPVSSPRLENGSDDEEAEYAAAERRSNSGSRWRCDCSRQIERFFHAGWSGSDAIVPSRRWSRSITCRTCFGSTAFLA